MKSQREKSCFKKAKFNILCTDLGRKCIYFTKPQFYLLAKSFELRWKWIPCMYKYVGTNIVSFLLKWRLWLKNSFLFTPWLHFSSHVTSKTFIQKTWSTENPGAFQSHTHVVRMRPVDCCEIFSQFYSSLYIVITCFFFLIEEPRRNCSGTWLCVDECLFFLFASSDNPSWNDYWVSARTKVLNWEWFSCFVFFLKAT